MFYPYDMDDRFPEFKKTIKSIALLNLDME